MIVIKTSKEGIIRRSQAGALLLSSICTKSFYQEEGGAIYGISARGLYLLISHLNYSTTDTSGNEFVFQVAPLGPICEGNNNSKMGGQMTSQIVHSYPLIFFLGFSEYIKSNGSFPNLYLFRHHKIYLTTTMLTARFSSRSTATHTDGP